MNDPEVMGESERTSPPIDPRELNFQLNCRRLILLFDLMIANEPEIIEKIVDRVLDIARDEWMYQRVKRGWVRVMVRTGSCIVRPFSRRVALQYIRDNASTAVVDALLKEILTRTKDGFTGESTTEDSEESHGDVQNLTGSANSSVPELDTSIPEETENPLVPIATNWQGSPQSSAVTSVSEQGGQERVKDALFNHPLRFAIGSFCAGVLMTGIVFSLMSGFRPVQFNNSPQSRELPQSTSIPQAPQGQ